MNMKHYKSQKYFERTGENFANFTLSYADNYVEVMVTFIALALHYKGKYHVAGLGKCLST